MVNKGLPCSWQHGCQDSTFMTHAMFILLFSFFKTKSTFFYSSKIFICNNKCLCNTVPTYSSILFEYTQLSFPSPLTFRRLRAVLIFIKVIKKMLALKYFSNALIKVGGLKRVWFSTQNNGIKSMVFKLQVWVSVANKYRTLWSAQ